MHVFMGDLQTAEFARRKKSDKRQRAGKVLGFVGKGALLGAGYGVKAGIGVGATRGAASGLGKAMDTMRAAKAKGIRLQPASKVLGTGLLTGVGAGVGAANQLRPRNLLRNAGAGAALGAAGTGALVAGLGVAAMRQRRKARKGVRGKVRRALRR
jgi:hypothetical protein